METPPKLDSDGKVSSSTFPSLCLALYACNILCHGRTQHDDVDGVDLGAMTVLFGTICFKR